MELRIDGNTEPRRDGLTEPKIDGDTEIRTMTQEERWNLRYNEVKSFIEANHRNPSKHDPEERFKYYNWIKHNRQLLNSGEMKQERVALFERLLSLCEEYKRVNQYQ